MKPLSNISKLTLSADELQLVNDTQWILTKRVIIDKVCQLFGEVAEDQKKIMENNRAVLPAELEKSSPKITKGENYLQLPYVILDHPRFFDGENIFAIRTMFWWGNFFSMTLQLSGRYKALFEESIISNLKAGQAGLFVCVNDDQWQHHFEAGNYIALELLNAGELERITTRVQFIKLAVKFPLDQWNDIGMLLEKSFTAFMDMLHDQLPIR
ncbi:MAG TPA: hypothetical protein VHL77_05610 [Ferruginibacter sp.]|nr:hypothetical protein [Ferruginibacter sp.]